jgi:hypothetical protein
MKPSLLVKQHSYDPPEAGKCIYCLKAFPEGELTREHIIPLALHGEMVIQHSVCEPCRDKSNRVYENPALQADFLVPRLLLELRRRKKQEKKELPPVAVGDLVSQGALEEFSIRLEIEQHPRIFSLIMPTVAGKLVGIDRGSTLRDPRVGFINLGGDKNATGVTTRHAMNPTAFSLTLAKIAYCFACAERGLGGLDEIRDLLAGNRDDVYNFVGSWSKKQQLTKKYLHNLYFRERGENLTVLVHLFASCGMDPYEVVVGKIK